MGGSDEKYKILGRKPEGTGLLSRYRFRQKHTIKMSI
jgi:hypothetical protein